MHLEMNLTKTGLRLEADLENKHFAVVEVYRDPGDDGTIPCLFDITICQDDRTLLLLTNLKTSTWPTSETVTQAIDIYLQDPQVREKWPGKHIVVSAKISKGFFDITIIPNKQAEYTTICRVYTEMVTEIGIKFKDYHQTTYVKATDVTDLLQNIYDELGKRCSSWIEEAIKEAGYETDENDSYILSQLYWRSLDHQG